MQPVRGICDSSSVPATGDAPVSKGVLTFTVDAYDSQVFWTECTQSDSIAV
jgi:hypothetical protein